MLVVLTKKEVREMHHKLVHDIQTALLADRQDWRYPGLFNALSSVLQLAKNADRGEETGPPR
jgi:hypothetical protein